MLRGVQDYQDAFEKYAKYQRTLIPYVVVSSKCGTAARIHAALR
jgi:hypothetical protein